jgi:hypothetical protein
MQLQVLQRKKYVKSLTMYARYGYNSVDGTSVSGPHARIVENKEVNDHGQEKSNEEKGN